ncbi:MAG: InlB B-repeat-containing protein [Ruminococcus sp.]|nr:InlB B-repeat-containing protein [Ruminococcus sp.]
MNLKKSLSILLAICTVFSVFACVPFTAFSAQTEVADTGAGMYGLVDDIQQGQILQCWNWSYQNIAANMSLIAQQGFSAIQTSPVQATKETTKESYNTVMNSSSVLYQPIALSMETKDYNALGTKSDFAYMCETAHKYGVKVIVDVVLNHMATGGASNTIHSDVTAELRDNADCWHSVTNNIADSDDRYELTHYCLSGAPDLNTGNATVQTYCTNLLKEAIEAGADGFRFDSAKNIETDWDATGTSSDFWSKVLGDATAFAQETRGITPYYYGEILNSPGGGLSIEAYTRYMSVTDNASSDTIRNGIQSGNASAAITSAISNGAANNKAVQWTESHNDYKNFITRSVSDENINKTWAIIGARNEVCGLYLARPADMSTTMMGAADHTSWRLPAVKAVNNFKNHFAGQEEYFSSYSNFACVERGTSGMVIVNTSGTNSSVSGVPVHKMAAGTYKDAITGNIFTVQSGSVSGEIGDTGIAVIYDVDNSGTFTKGDVTDVAIAGAFNDWDVNANKMIAVDGNTVETSMFLEAGTYEFKVATTNGIWYGNSGTVEDTTTATSAVGWEMTSANQDNCKLAASGGKYTFSFNVSTGMLVVEHENTTDTTSTYYLKGSFNEWGTSHPMEYTVGSNVVTTTMVLAQGTYTFKINNADRELWYGNSGTITDTTGADGWVMDTAAGDCTLTATGGTYKFAFDLSTQKLVVTTDAVVETTTQGTTTEAATAQTVYLKGDFNSWSEDTPMDTAAEDGVVTVTLTLEGGSYKFKINTGDTWYGNGGVIEDTTEATSEIGWEMDAAAGDCTLNATGGTYTFIFNTNTRFLVILFGTSEPDPEESVFTVTFKDYNGMVLSEQQVDKGSSATAPASPARPADAQYTYTFAGWDKDFSNITADTVVTAVYDSKINVYTVAFMSYDGTVISTQQVEYGKGATAPEAPARDGYVFTGWDTAFDNITKDTTVTAQYRERGESYTVTFVDFDGTVLSTQLVEAGESAQAPESPVREGYTFLGWDTEFDNVTKDITVTATYSELTVFLMGSFNEWQQVDAMMPADDSNVVSVEVELDAGTYYFKVLQDGEWFGNPGIIEDTTEITSASGWLMEIGADNCTLNATGGLYTFNFNLSTGSLIVLHRAQLYTVTFVDYDGTVLSTQRIEKGAAAKSPAYPEREADAQYTYVFSGWDTEYSDVQSDLTITATYVSIANKYTVTFADFDGTVLRTQSVEYGASAVAPTAPVRDGYVFTGWDKSFNYITGDTTVTAQYRTRGESVTTTIGSLKIDIISGTGFKISINDSAVRPQGVSYINSQVTYNSSVTITANSVADKEFIGWVNSANGSILTTEYTYTFTTTGKDYLKALYVTDYSGINTVIFKNDKAASGNGQILDMQYYAAGDEISYPDAPAQVGFEFAGWSMTDEEIQAELTAGNDVTILAIWNRVKTYVDVEIIGGTGTGSTNAVGQYSTNSAMYLTADEAPEGKKFAYWTADGDVICYSSSCKYFPTDAVVLEAVFVDKAAEIDYQVIVNVDAVDTETLADKNIFYFSWCVPEEELGVTYVKSGILAMNKNGYTGDNLVVGTTDENVYDRSPAGTTSATAVNSYTWTKSDVTLGQTWVARAYVQYKNAAGETLIVYSDVVEATKE